MPQLSASFELAQLANEFGRIATCLNSAVASTGDGVVTLDSHSLVERKACGAEKSEASTLKCLFRPGRPITGLAVVDHPTTLKIAISTATNVYLIDSSGAEFGVYECVDTANCIACAGDVVAIGGPTGVTLITHDANEIAFVSVPSVVRCLGKLESPDVVDNVLVGCGDG